MRSVRAGLYRFNKTVCQATPNPFFGWAWTFANACVTRTARREGWCFPLTTMPRNASVLCAQKVLPGVARSILSLHIYVGALQSRKKGSCVTGYCTSARKNRQRSDCSLLLSLARLQKKTMAKRMPTQQQQRTIMITAKITAALFANLLFRLAFCGDARRHGGCDYVG